MILKYNLLVLFWLGGLLGGLIAFGLALVGWFQGYFELTAHVVPIVVLGILLLVGGQFCRRSFEREAPAVEKSTSRRAQSGIPITNASGEPRALATIEEVLANEKCDLATRLVVADIGRGTLAGLVIVLIGLAMTCAFTVVPGIWVWLGIALFVPGIGLLYLGLACLEMASVEMYAVARQTGLLTVGSRFQHAAVRYWWRTRTAVADGAH